MKKLGMVKGCLVILGVFFISSAQALCLSPDDLYGEGIPYKCEEKKTPVVTAKLDCVDLQSFYTEGIPYECAKGVSTKLSSNTLAAMDLYTEGLPENYGNQLLSVATLKEHALRAKPASGATK